MQLFRHYNFIEVKLPGYVAFNRQNKPPFSISFNPSSASHYRSKPLSPLYWSPGVGMPGKARPSADYRFPGQSLGSELTAQPLSPLGQRPQVNPFGTVPPQQPRNLFHVLIAALFCLSITRPHWSA